ncbi:MAG: T9SS type A sorting domain-containing protein [Saprospiraceae bacterium]
MPVEGLVELFNLNGEVVLRQPIRHLPLDQLTVDIHPLPSGVYFLQIQDLEQGNMLVQRRVVVQH